MKHVTQRALVIQLARLGDLVQTIPAITALKECYGDWDLDLLCPTPLEPIGRLLPGISTVVGWDGAAWKQRAVSAELELRPEHIAQADEDLRTMTPSLYDHAFVLNQHPRGLLAGALLAKTVSGTGIGGPLDQRLSPWATYVKAVAAARRTNRVHLADAFCGMCGVVPPKQLIPIEVPAAPLPVDLDSVGRFDGPWIGLIVGAGDRERMVPESTWVSMISACLDAVPRSRVVLVGHRSEQERAQYIQTALPSSLLGRVWDTTGRLSLSELAIMLNRCRIVIGADTGPLHLAAAVGAQVIGWYFARARVHETGPYGSRHWVWQADGPETDKMGFVQPSRWPIDETVALISGQTTTPIDNWSLWTSHWDRWGAYYAKAGDDPIPPLQREQVWRDLQPSAA